MPQYQGVWNLAQQAQALTRQQWVTDPLFDYTTLLLQGDNVSGSSQNNVFVDSSANNFLITRNGNTTQGSFSPFSQQSGYWGNYFSGSNDYLQSAASATLAFSGNFTIEAFVYLQSSSGGFAPGILYQTSDNSISAFELYNGSATPTLFGITSTNTVTRFTFTGPTVPTNTWVHVAFVRNSNVVRAYINGQECSNTLSNSATTGQILQIANGRSISSGNQWPGYLSNVRFTSTAVYTAAFNPPVNPLTDITGTVLLTCQSNRFIDANTQQTAKVLSVTGSPSVQAFSPFAPQYQYTPTVTGGSGYFDGTGDWLRVPYSANWENLGTGDFEISCWFYLNNLSGDRTLLSAISSWTTLVAFAMEVRTTKALHFWAGDNVPISISGGSVEINCWNYAVASRVSGTTRLFLNGTQIGTPHTGSVNINDNEDLGVGTFLAGNVVTSANSVNGYMTGVRIRKGVGVTSVTMPTTPPTADANTQLLLNFTNAGILDGTMKNNLETVGNAQVSTSVVKYGSGSMYFDGTDDRLLIPTVSQNQAMGTGDWTVEFWFYSTITTFSNWRIMLDFRPNTTNGAYITCSINSSAQPIFYTQAAERIIGSAIVSNQWYHFAVCKANNVTRMFINGVQNGSTYSDTNNYLDSGRILVGGGGYTLGTEMFLGYIDDLRITRGIARYTRNFIPPQVALPRQ